MYQQCSIIKHCFYIISTFLKYIVSTLFVHGLWWMLKSCSINVFNNVPTMFKQCSLIKTLFLHYFYIVSTYLLYTNVTLFVHALWQMLKSCSNNVFNNVPTMFKQCSLIKTLFLHCFYIFTIHFFYTVATLFVHCLYMFCDEGWNHVQSMYSIMFQQCSNNVVLFKHCFYIVSTYLLYIFLHCCYIVCTLFVHVCDKLRNNVLTMYSIMFY